MKNMKKLIGIAFISLIVLTGCTIAGYSSEDIYEVAQEASLNSMPDVEDGTAMYYFFQEDCTHCQNIKDDVADFYYETKDDIEMYFVDMADEVNWELWASSGSDLSSYGLDGLTIEGTPTLVKTEDGSIDYVAVGEDNILNVFDEFVKV